MKCWNCGARLDDIYDATGIPKWQLLRWPPPEELGAPTRRNGQYIGRPPARLSVGMVGGYASALWAQEHEHALDWMRARGLTDGMIRRAKLGYDQSVDAITIPVWEGGRLANLRRRFLSPSLDGQKMVGLRGRGSQLYPSIPAEGDLIIVAGELDGLIGRQHGLPTVTTTCGATLPQHLVPALAGRTVAVMYDVGEEIAARLTTHWLRTANSDAWVVRLAKLGLPFKADLNDALLAGITPDEIRKLVRDERRRAAA